MTNSDYESDQPPSTSTSKGKGKGKQRTNNSRSDEIKRRSSKACDNCRKAKSKCSRILDPATQVPIGACQNCLTVGAECTFNGQTRKRGPPKGYIEAIESRLHRMEALLGGLLQNDDPRAQALLGELIGDEESREMLTRDLKHANMNNNNNDPSSSSNSTNAKKPEKSWKREFALQQEALALQEKKRLREESSMLSSSSSSIPPPQHSSNPTSIPATSTNQFQTSSFSPGFGLSSNPNILSPPSSSTTTTGIQIGETPRWFTEDDLNFGGVGGGDYGATSPGGRGSNTFSFSNTIVNPSHSSTTTSSLPISLPPQPPSTYHHQTHLDPYRDSNVVITTSPRQRRKTDQSSILTGGGSSSSSTNFGGTNHEDRKQMAYHFNLPSNPTTTSTTIGTSTSPTTTTTGGMSTLPASFRAMEGGHGLPRGAIAHTGQSSYTLSSSSRVGGGAGGGTSPGLNEDRGRGGFGGVGGEMDWRDQQFVGGGGGMGQSPGGNSIRSSTTNATGGGGMGGGGGADSPTTTTTTTTSQMEGPASELADVVGQLSLNENEEVRYHGRSSGLYLISKSRRFRDFFWQFPSAGVWPPADGRVQKTEREILQLKDGEEALPDLETQHHLLQAYWTYVHPHFPILYKVSFMRQYRHSLAHPNSSTSSTTSSAASPSSNAFGQGPVPTVLLLSMFALSARYCDLDSTSGQDGKYWNAGQEYLDRAKAILNNEYGTKLVSVQALLLMSYREIGVGAMSSAWMAGGMAIRMAQDLGLFRDVEKWFLPVQRFTHEEKQTRKRIWWGCIIIDRYSSSYIGRPGTIHERDYDTGFCSEDEPDEHEQWRPIRLDGTDYHSPAKHVDSHFTEEITRGLQNYPTTRANTLSCFNAHAALAVIINRIISNIYAIRIRVLGQSSETLLSLLDQSLASWFLALPPHLAYNPASSKVPPPHILALHLQFYSSLILLHRPFIPGQNSSQSPGNFPSHSICTTSANAIANIVTAWRKTFTLRQCPPFVTYPIFSAAIICVYNASFDEALARPAKVHLLQCMNALKEMELQWGSAIRAFELLHGLVDLRDAELNAELAGLNAEGEGRGTKRPTMDVDEPTDEAFQEVRPTNFHANRPVVGRATSTKRKPSRSTSTGGSTKTNRSLPTQPVVPSLSSPSIPQVPFFSTPSPQDWRVPPTVAPSPVPTSLAPPAPPPLVASTAVHDAIFAHAPPDLADRPSVTAGPSSNLSAQTFDILNPSLDLSQFRSPPGTSGGPTNFSDLLNSFLSPTEAASLPNQFSPTPIAAPNHTQTQPGTPFDPTSAFFGMPLGAVDEWFNYSYTAFGSQQGAGDSGHPGGGSLSPEGLQHPGNGPSPTS